MRSYYQLLGGLLPMSPHAVLLDLLLRTPVKCLHQRVTSSKQSSDTTETTDDDGPPSYLSSTMNYDPGRGSLLRVYNPKEILTHIREQLWSRDGAGPIGAAGGVTRLFCVLRCTPLVRRRCSCKTTHRVSSWRNVRMAASVFSLLLFSVVLLVVYAAHLVLDFRSMSNSVT